MPLVSDSQMEDHMQVDDLENEEKTDMLAKSLLKKEEDYPQSSTYQELREHLHHVIKETTTEKNHELAELAETFVKT